MWHFKCKKHTFANQTFGEQVIFVVKAHGVRVSTTFCCPRLPSVGTPGAAPHLERLVGVTSGHSASCSCPGHGVFALLGPVPGAQAASCWTCLNGGDMGGSFLLETLVTCSDHTGFPDLRPSAVPFPLCPSWWGLQGSVLILGVHAHLPKGPPSPSVAPRLLSHPGHLPKLQTHCALVLSLSSAPPLQLKRQEGTSHMSSTLLTQNPASPGEFPISSFPGSQFLWSKPWVSLDLQDPIAKPTS